LAAGAFVLFFMGGEGWRGRGEEGRRRVAQRGREGGRDEVVATTTTKARGMCPQTAAAFQLNISNSWHDP
jgi:hypothetical protein